MHAFSGLIFARIMFTYQGGLVALVAQSFQVFQVIPFLQLVRRLQRYQVIQWPQYLLQNLEFQAVRCHLGVLGLQVVPPDRSIRKILWVPLDQPDLTDLK